MKQANMEKLQFTKLPSDRKKTWLDKLCITLAEIFLIPEREGQHSHHSLLAYSILDAPQHGDGFTDAHVLVVEIAEPSEGDHR